MKIQLESWEKKSRRLRSESKVLRSIKIIFFCLIELHGKFVKTEFIEPNKLRTKNRKDIDLYVKFLEDSLKKKKIIEDTEIFKKVVQNGILPENIKLHLEHLLILCKNIEKNGIKKPIIVAKINSPIIKIWHLSNDKKIWKDFKNETGFQLIEGTHRLPIAIYLKLEKIPVKFYKPLLTQIPNFTEILQINDK